MENNRQFEIIGEPLFVDWNKHGDEWLARFGQALVEQGADIQLTGWHYDETTKPFIEIRTADVSDPSVEYQLSVACRDDEILLLVALDRMEKMPGSIVNAWLDSARVATESLGKKYPKHAWSAIIGPIPLRMSEARIGVDSEGLAAAGRFGELEFSSGGRHVIEMVQNPEIPSFGGSHIHGSVPIVVRGSSRGYSWRSAGVSAARDLNRACAILSISWGVCMTIRQSPAPLEWGLRSVPDRPVGFPADAVPHVPANPIVDREIPGWGDAAWKTVTKKIRIADAIAAFHEGFKVETTNPSWALVAYIASIEAISQTIFHDNRCTECPSYRYIGAKFAETLRLVLPDDKAEELRKLYSTRSNTVHRGRLYGFESTTGSMQQLLWSPNNDGNFMFGSVYPMREAAREILTLALKGELPSKRVYSPEE